MLEERTGNKPSVGTLHSALYRLEKGCVKPNEGGATVERGGRRKRYYKLTAYGKEILMEAYQLRMEFARQIPGPNLGLGK